MGVEPFLIGAAVSAVVAQRLARKLCTHCCEMYTPTVDELMKARVSREVAAASDGMVFYRKKGCPRCNQTGYKGRIGVYQLLTMSEQLETLAVTKASREDIERAAIGEGMRTLWDDGLAKVAAGLTSIEELARVPLSRRFRSGSSSRVGGGPGAVISLALIWRFEVTAGRPTHLRSLGHCPDDGSAANLLPAIGRCLRHLKRRSSGRGSGRPLVQLRAGYNRPHPELVRSRAKAGFARPFRLGSVAPAQAARKNRSCGREAAGFSDAPTGHASQPRTMRASTASVMNAVAWWTSANV
jgi:hypothetical protein